MPPCASMCRRFLRNASPLAGDAPTVYDQRLARHKRGLVGGQKQHRVGDFFDGADASKRP